MKNIIISLLFSIFTILSFTFYSSGESLKEKCNSAYRTCIEECKKKHSHGRDIFKCQGECGKKKMDCKKSAAKGKKYSWED